MNDTNDIRRKRKRKPTMNGRFAASSLALEIGLIRMSADMARDLDKKETAEILQFVRLLEQA